MIGIIFRFPGIAVWSDGWCMTGYGRGEISFFLIVSHSKGLLSGREKCLVVVDLA
jgi:hypothetical protein